MRLSVLNEPTAAGGGGTLALDPGVTGDRALTGSPTPGSMADPQGLSPTLLIPWDASGPPSR